MSTAIQLLHLTCVHCATPLAAHEAEVAWQCQQCQNGTQLTDRGLAPVAVQWAAARPGRSHLGWRPFWIFSAQVRFSERRTYRGDNRPDPLWAAPRRFYIPAFAIDIRQLESIGSALARLQPALRPGPIAGSLAGCTLMPSEALAAAEFVVITIEAERKDMLRTLNFTLENPSQPELWMLPFEGDQLLLA